MDGTPKKPTRKMTQGNFESTSTLPESTSKSLFKQTNWEDFTQEEVKTGKVLIKREDIQDYFKQLLVDSGLVNKELDAKVNYFFGPYSSKHGDRPQKTKIEYSILKQLMRDNKKLPAGAPKKEKWVAILEHISRNNKYLFKDFVSRLGPSAFPYVRQLCERACNHGLEGGAQNTKLPPIQPKGERSVSMKPIRTIDSFEDDCYVGEEILNVENYKIMEEVKDQTQDPLVAPIVYVLRNTKEFIHDDVVSGVPIDETKQYMKEFNEFQEFLKSMCLGRYTKTKNMFNQDNGDDRFGSSKTVGQKKVRSKFSNPTISSAARGLPIMSNFNTSKNKMRRGFTTKVDSSKKLLSSKKINKSKYKTAKDKPIIENSGYESDASVSSDDANAE